MSTTFTAACVPLRLPSTQKFVLMALADQANAQGLAWVAISTICEWTCLSERAVRNAIRALEDDGFLSTTSRRRDNGSRTSNSYTLLPARFHAAADGAAQPAQPAGVESKLPPEVDAQQPARRAGGEAPATGTSCPTPRHDVPGFDPYPYPIPRNTPPNPPVGGQAPGGEPLMELATAIAAANEAGEKFLPAGDAVFAYAERVGISRELLELHWREFKRRRGDAKKRQRGVVGWRKAFRRSVEDNWFRLWFLRVDEPAQLTTQGLQAQRHWAADQQPAAQPQEARDEG
jgi:hypothetical protein